MKFGIGVILYRPDEKVRERIETYSRISDYVFIYDNTERASELAMNEYLNRSNYYSNNKNNGMSKALEWIFRMSVQNEIDILLTMDQDSDFSADNINKMLDYIHNCSRENVAIFAPNYCKLYFDSKTQTEVSGNLKIDTNEERLVNFAMTSGSFYKVTLLKKILPLDDLFIGYVDQDICYMLIQQGYRVMQVGSIVLKQRVGGQVLDNWFNKTFRVLHHTKERYYYMTRNNLLLREKFRKNPEIYKELKLGLLRIFLNIILGEKKKIEKFYYCYIGNKDFKKRFSGSIALNRKES